MGAAFERSMPFDPISIFDASPSELDDLPVGIISLDRLGFVKSFNQAEAEHARRSAQTTLGRNFFDIAPCACVHAYEGRFRSFALGTTTESERFRFTYPFRWGARDVDIMFVRREGDDRIFIITRTAGLAALVSMTSDAERAAEIVRLIESKPPLVRRLNPEAIWVDDLVSGQTRWSDGLYALCELDAGRRSRSAASPPSRIPTIESRSTPSWRVLSPQGHPTASNSVSSPRAAASATFKSALR